ncbi:pyruvate ferredoxin oxidoreductase [archaeon]|nr:MAG: pyruvate ferredoxin oxidoreductase [archaeon]RLG65664.1 MAG: pyruvate ferredoxin oxidoreductase [archaeon]RLG65678.1 MAG: pyruvate ferredoxin oxidoreductase [archaeon]HDM23580.1 pyruvate ferredoxin oxidoreductase [Candidatus Bathyarchaeota archaeon]
MSWINLRELAKKRSLFTSGHRLCAGCAAGIIGRLVMHSVPDPKHVVVVHATGCWEVAGTIFPYTAWAVPWIHNAFENAAATASGVELAFKALKDKGVVKKVPDIIVFGGDGGTVDIGLQSLSGAIERGHNFLYVLYDNNAYMNTGIQRSGATPRYAWTTTSQVGKVIPGKLEARKPIANIIAAHGNAYVATASPAYWRDLMEKARKGIEYKGPAFIHAISPCCRGWRFPPNMTIRVAKLAVETCAFPLWEYDPETREYKLSPPSLAIAKNPKLKKPIEEYLKLQGRFAHLFKPEKREDLIARIQEDVDKEWNQLLELCGIT